MYENVEEPETQPDHTYDMAEQQLQDEQQMYKAVDDVPAKSEAEQPAEDAGLGEDLYDNMGMDTEPTAEVHNLEFERRHSECNLLSVLKLHIHWNLCTL